METDSLREHLLQLELKLMRPEFRSYPERLAALLDPDFFEIGSSGRLWSRDAILELLASESGFEPPMVEDFQLRPFAPDLALVTYRTRRTNGSLTLRSSLWRRVGTDWRCVFHQGTPERGERER